MYFLQQKTGSFLNKLSKDNMMCYECIFLLKYFIISAVEDSCAVLD